MPGLTTSHLGPNSFEKMRVSLAFQLFGDYILHSLHHYKDLIKTSYGKGSLDGTESFFRYQRETSGNACCQCCEIELHHARTPKKDKKKRQIPKKSMRNEMGN